MNGILEIKKFLILNLKVGMNIKSNSFQLSKANLIFISINI